MRAGVSIPASVNEHTFQTAVPARRTEGALRQTPSRSPGKSRCPWNARTEGRTAFSVCKAGRTSLAEDCPAGKTCSKYPHKNLFLKAIEETEFAQD